MEQSTAGFLKMQETKKGCLYETVYEVLDHASGLEGVADAEA